MRAGEIADAGVVHVGGLVSRNHIVPDAHLLLLLLLLLLLSLSLCRALARSLFVGGVLSSTTLFAVVLSASEMDKPPYASTRSRGLYSLYLYVVFFFVERIIVQKSIMDGQRNSTFLGPLAQFMGNPFGRL